MAEFELNGTKYLSGHIDGTRLWHIARRLGPALTAITNLQPLIALVNSEAENSEFGAAPADPDAPKMDLNTLMKAFRPVATELQQMSDTDVDYIINSCMDVTQRQVTVGQGWMRVRDRGVVNDENDNAMLSRLAITYYVLKDNFQEAFNFAGVSIAAIVGSKKLN